MEPVSRFFADDAVTITPPRLNVRRAKTIDVATDGQGGTRDMLHKDLELGPRPRQSDFSSRHQYAGMAVLSFRALCKFH
jgi:hypothetical protein